MSFSPNTIFSSIFGACSFSPLTDVTGDSGFFRSPGELPLLTEELWDKLKADVHEREEACVMAGASSCVIAAVHPCVPVLCNPSLNYLGLRIERMLAWKM